MYYELIFRKFHSGRILFCAYLQLIRGTVPHKLLRMHILNILNDIPSILYCPCKLHDADTLANGIQHINEHFIKILNSLELLIYEVCYLLVNLIFREWLHFPIKTRHSKLSCLHL